MNYTSFIVKLLNNPATSFVDNDIYVAKVNTLFFSSSNTKSNSILHLVLWNDLAQDIMMYYQKGDFIIIEGYISIKNYSSFLTNSVIDEKIEISIVKIYPFFVKNVIK